MDIILSFGKRVTSKFRIYVKYSNNDKGNHHLSPLLRTSYYST